jgi:hypothetical protein
MAYGQRGSHKFLINGHRHTRLNIGLFLSRDISLPPIRLIYGDAKGLTSRLEVLRRPFRDRSRLGRPRPREGEARNGSVSNYTVVGRTFRKRQKLTL